MSTNQIYGKTMKFVWLKLGLGLIMTVISIVLFAIIMGICSLIGGSTIFAGACIWIILFSGIYAVVMHYFGYMLKASHIAIVSLAVTTGQVPQNMVKVGKDMVVSRFGATNVYFVLDRLIGGAVRQLQKTVGKVGNLAADVPGVGALVSFAQTFIGIALGYIDECCLGYTFYKKDEGAFKSSCDGVAIYFQNIKHLLKSALVTSLLVAVLSFVAWLLPFAIIALIFSALNIHWVFAMIIALFPALAIKSAFIDSYVMVRTMVAYMQVAPSTQVTVDIYGKLCKLSNKFKKLFDKASNEPAMAQTAPAAQPVYQQPVQQPVQQQMYQQPVQQQMYQQPVQQQMYQQPVQQQTYQQPTNMQ